MAFDGITLELELFQPGGSCRVLGGFDSTLAQGVSAAGERLVVVVCRADNDPADLVTAPWSS
jgi:hypothetical protein